MTGEAIENKRPLAKRRPCQGGECDRLIDEAPRSGKAFDANTATLYATHMIRFAEIRDLWKTLGTVRQHGQMESDRRGSEVDHSSNQVAADLTI